MWSILGILHTNDDLLVITACRNSGAWRVRGIMHTSDDPLDVLGGSVHVWSILKVPLGIDDPHFD